MSVDLEDGSYETFNSNAENWKITLADTGEDTLTGGRLKKIAKYLNDETFCMTYGDGLSDLDVTEEIKFHKKHKKLATIGAVKPPARFGTLNIGKNNQVINFEEKSHEKIGWINGGFLFLSPKCSNTLMTTKHPGSINRYLNLPKIKNWSRFIMTAFGTLVTPYETKES